MCVSSACAMWPCDDPESANLIFFGEMHLDLLGVRYKRYGQQVGETIPVCFVATNPLKKNSRLSEKGFRGMPRGDPSPAHDCRSTPRWYGTRLVTEACFIVLKIIGSF
jgi:hypothetical protein